MAVKYVNDFSFPSDFGFHGNSGKSVPGKSKGFAKGGHATTPQRYKEGGLSKYSGHGKKSDDKGSKPAGASNLSYGKASTRVAKTTAEKSSGVQKPAFSHGGSCGCKMCSGGVMKKAEGGKVAHGKIPSKKQWNPNDDVSPGSPKRTPPKQGAPNKSIAKNQFATESENTPPATKQVGDVERMTAPSDFKHGGKAKHDRIKNLGHYAHGGKVVDKAEKAAGTPKKSGDGSKSEKGSGRATGKHTQKAQGTRTKDTTEKHPKATRTEHMGDRGQHNAPGNAEAAIPMAGGGLSRGTSPKQRKAIHAKQHAPSLAGPLAAAAEAISGPGIPHQPAGPGAGPTPPGMAPGMGQPPGGQMGNMRGPAGPAMSHGGGVKHTVVHHVHYKR
jgi:hypothetical protein